MSSSRPPSSPSQSRLHLPFKLRRCLETPLTVSWTTAGPPSDPVTFAFKLFNTVSSASFGTLATAVEASGLTKTVSLPSFPGLRAPLSSGWFIQFVSADGGSDVFSASQPFSVDPTFGIPQYCTPFRSFQENNLSGPIAGAVVGGIIVVLAAGVFVLCRTRWRTQRTSLLPLANPFMLGTWTPAHRFNILPVETDPAPPTLARDIPPARERVRNTVQLQQQIRELTERAEAPGLAQPYDANVQLLEEIRMPKFQMSAMQRQQQHIQAVMDQGLPEYTSSPT
ncbi:hypothetical protein B0H13DRAFT_2392524 [Mycena leptocephala]|nr:hypothetical protein B0H13DRAFT_2392524 [Mycena leptocephala]